MLRHVVSITVMELLLFGAFSLILLVRHWISASRQSRAPRRQRRRPLRGTAAILWVGLLATLISVGMAVRATPVPRIHDEFSHLLLADTLLHGRLANPTHPLWQHFETFYVLHTPSYASMYPPALGGLLAVGWALTGHPVGGVCLGIGLAAACACWMLQGWLPPRWALLGALMIALHSTLHVTWFNYWGGTVAMIGGALLFGAWGRHLKRPTARGSILMALGAVTLGFSRPFEGLIISLPVACSTLSSTAGSRNGTTIARVLVPAGCMLLLGAALLARYNSAVTGSPTRLPAAEWGRQYSPRPIFLWQHKTAAPQVQHEVMRGWANRRSEWEKQQTLRGFIKVKVGQFADLWRSYLRAALTIPLVTLPWLVRSPRMRQVLLVLVLLGVSSSMVAWLYPHYWSAVFPLIILVVLQGMRIWWLGARKAGRSASRLLVAALIGTSILTQLTIIADRAIWPVQEDWSLQRQEIRDDLAASRGRHLVIVRYSPTHDFDHEWVYNEAAIDASPVVWARDMGSRNAELVEYFSDRRVWLLEADSEPGRLQPYAEPAPSSHNPQDRLQP